MNNIIEIVIAGVVAWILALEVRLRSTQSKLLKEKEKNDVEALKSEVHSMPDDKLDRAIANDIGNGNNT